MLSALQPALCVWQHVMLTPPRRRRLCSSLARAPMRAVLAAALARAAALRNALRLLFDVLLEGTASPSMRKLIVDFLKSETERLNDPGQT